MRTDVCRNANQEKKKKQERKCFERWFTLSVSTSEIISLIVASSPIPYSFMADSNSSTVINLCRHSEKSPVLDLVTRPFQLSK